ncbi:MAG: M4 family metallopeptidase [Saprospiraceae bacterium]
MKFLFTCLSILFTFSAFAQIKPHLEQFSADESQTIDLDALQPIKTWRAEVPNATNNALNFNQLYQQPLGRYQKMPKEIQGLKVINDLKTERPIFISGTLEDKANLSEIPTTKTAWIAKGHDYLVAVGGLMEVKNPQAEFTPILVETDELGQTHIKYQQQYNGVEIYGAEVIVHTDEAVVTKVNGRYYPTPALEMTANLSAQQVLASAKSELPNFKELHGLQKQLIAGEQESVKQVVFYQNETPRLAYQINLIPNLAENWTYIIDANTGETLRKFSNICDFHYNINDEKATHHGICSHDHQLERSGNLHPNQNLPPDGPTITNTGDLFNRNQSINTYESGGGFFYIDASRPMYNTAASNIPDDPSGVIWTIDAFDSAPQNDNFEVGHVFSNSNAFQRPIATSAHVNAGQSFEYFSNVFSRNSINGQGGNIVSLINITDEDGSAMDNAFWNGNAMFYGNGNRDFSQPLARSLDVAAHEMTHGVIQATANLEYQGESGALNESFADIFAVLIDRDDFTLGEDVVNTSIFRSGALRDLANPNNGGSSLADIGYQPANVSDQFLGSQDNGGVHINSGIVNNAFYRFATNNSVGLAKAERVYYRALTRYLTRSSQFVDARLAVIQATEDLHGAGSSEAQAAAQAFSAVGIIGNESTIEDDLVDLEENPGTEFILLSDASLSQLYLSTPNGEILENPLQQTSILSRPSITDNGREAVYIARDNTMRLFNFAQGQEVTIQSEPIWRNVVISKDGNRIAAITSDLEPRIVVFDLVSNRSAAFTLDNPTYTQGVETGDVQFADAMEFDPAGEFLMYDAKSAISSSFGESIEYWDIGFLRVWNNATNDYGDGFISKLFSGLPQDISIGNPTFAKNSPFIVAFDYIDEFENEYELQAVNIERNQVNTLFQNLQLSYPSYSVDDKNIIFDAQTDTDEVLAIMPVANDKINSGGDAGVLITSGKWGVWFATGERNLETNVETLNADEFLTIAPNPFSDKVTIELKNTTFTPQLLEVTNLLGQVVYQTETMRNDVLELDLKALAAGAYLIRLTADNQQVVQKIIKK